jgi:hypothetical protein
MGKPYSKEQYQVDFEHYISDKGLADSYYEEIAAKEDAICDDEDADTTDIKLCMSDKREQQASHNYDKKSCEQVNGDWNKKKGSGCTFYEDEQQDVMDAAETQRKLIDEEEQKQLQEIADYNAAQAQKQQEEPEVIEDWGNTVKTEEEQARDKVIKILEESEEGNEVHGGAELEYVEADSSDEEEEQDEPEESNDDESEESSDSNENEESE